MKLNKKLVAIVLGVAVLGTTAVGVAFADTSTTPAQSTQNNLSQTFLGNLASTLNISQSTLTGDIQTAETQTVNQAVSNGQLTQTQATQVLSRISKGNFQFLGFGGNRKGGMGNRTGGGSFMTLKPLATALGLTPKVLMSDLRSGQTISALASTKGTTVAALQSAILSSVQTQLAQSVTNGKLTQTQENQILQNINSGNWVTQLQNMGQHQRPAATQPSTSQPAQ
jgi:3-hydroxyacyl-CoA dehydrogenase